MRRSLLAGLALTLAEAPLAAHAQAKKSAEPLVEFEMMTWPEVKAAMDGGKTMALFYTGGTEQRGPQNVNGGHTLMGKATVKEIALRLGNAIAMPVLPFSPTGVDPENPGSIDLPAETLGIVLENVSEAAIANGFKNVILMGDSGGGQGPNGVYAAVSKKLDAKYGPKGIHVYYADSPYYAARDAFNKIIAERGLPGGTHGGIQDTSEMMYLETLPGNSNWVRKDQLPNSEGIAFVDGKPQRGPNSPHNGITDSWTYRWNAQVFAGWGYVVAWHNFHGSSGFRCNVASRTKSHSHRSDGKRWRVIDTITKEQGLVSPGLFLNYRDLLFRRFSRVYPRNF